MKVSERDVAEVKAERRRQILYAGAPPGCARVRCNEVDHGCGFFAVMSWKHKIDHLSGVSAADCAQKAIRFCTDVWGLRLDEIFVNGLCAVHLASGRS